MLRWLFIYLLFCSSAICIAQNQDELVDKLEQFKFRNWDSVEYYSRKILENSGDEHLREKGLAWQYMGVVQYEKYGNYDSALSLYNKAREHFKEDVDSIQLGTLHNNYGVIYKTMADYESALGHFFKAMEYYSSDTVSKYRIITLNNIGEVNLWLGNMEESEKYHLLAYEAALAKGDSLLLGLTMVNLGNLANTGHEYRKAIDYYKKSLAYYSGYKYNTANIIMNIGTVHHFRGNLKKAIEYYQKAIDKAIEFNSSHSLAIGYLNIGEAMLDAGEPEAVSMLNKAIDVASRYRLKRVLRYAYQFLARYYQEHNQYDKALVSFKQYKIYNDSILNENSLNRLNALNVKFNTAQKEKQIADQALEIEQKNAAILKQRNRNILIASVLTILVLTVLFIYLRYRMKEHARLQQVVIREKEKGLKAVFEAIEQERQRISQDLHDGVGQQLSGIKMQLESMPAADKRLLEQKSKITANIAQVSKEVREISHQMMPRSLQEQGLVPSLEDLFNKTFSNTPVSCSFEHHNADRRFPKEVEISLYRIVQEIINNIIKHANASRVIAQLYKINNKLLMTIEDDGVGFDPRAGKSGHGLLNIKTRIETVNGKIKFESSENNKTIITLSIPLN